MINGQGKIKIVILAGGKGKRMESELPKVLVALKGKPMISHIISEIQKISNQKPVAIVGHKAELVQSELGDLCFYAFQAEQLGTGHAVSCAKGDCADAEQIVVLSGDQPFISAKTIVDLIEKQLSSKAKITFTTTEVPDFLDWRKAFLGFGKILRKDGEVVGIKEVKDANDEEKNIKEVNAGCYCFDAEWLWKNLGKIKDDNNQKEYYLTDLFKIAGSEGEKIETVKIDNHEALGANSKEELEILENFAV